MEFVINNWFLFLALIVVLVMLFYMPIMQKLMSIQSVPPVRLVQLVNHDSAVVIDVSEPQEFNQSHIPNAINVPLASVTERLTELKNKYQKKPVIISCRSGNRSMKAAMTLRKQGFESVSILSGGNNAWQRDNMPMAG